MPCARDSSRERERERESPPAPRRTHGRRRESGTRDPVESPLQSETGSGDFTDILRSRPTRASRCPRPSNAAPGSLNPCLRRRRRRQAGSQSRARLWPLSGCARDERGAGPGAAGPRPGACDGCPRRCAGRSRGEPPAACSGLCYSRPFYGCSPVPVLLVSQPVAGIQGSRAVPTCLRQPASESTGSHEPVVGGGSFRR